MIRYRPNIVKRDVLVEKCNSHLKSSHNASEHLLYALVCNADQLCFFWGFFTLVLVL